MRARTSATLRAASTATARGDAIRAELAAWQARALPDAEAPLEVDDLVRLLRDCVGALGLDPAIAAGVTVNTVHYYRRRDIIDPPEGRTAAARYGVRHLWQIAGARLAGHLGLVTLAEARDVMRDAEEPELLAFLAARVADARARDALRASPSGTPAADVPATAPGATAARPLPGRRATAASAPLPAAMIALPGDTWCVLPASHPALHDPSVARELANALLRALAAAPHTDPLT